jgi:hypothetical protein
MSVEDVALSLEGLPCWGVTFDSRSGVKIDLGAKRPRQRHISNPHLSNDVQDFVGSHDLFIQCPWRLAGLDNVELGDERNGGGLKELIGALLTDLEINEQTFDMVVTFSTGFKLLVRNSPDPEEGTNYSIKINGLHWVIVSGNAPKEEFSKVV